MRSLYWKLGAAMLFIVVVSVGLTAYLANLSTGREFETYMQQGTTMYTRNVSAGVGDSSILKIRTGRGSRMYLPAF